MEDETGNKSPGDPLPLEYRRYRPPMGGASSGGVAEYVLGFSLGLVGYLGVTGYLCFGIVCGGWGGGNPGPMSFLPMLLLDAGFVGLSTFLWMRDRRIGIESHAGFFRGVLSAVTIVSILQGLIVLVVWTVIYVH